MISLDLRGLHELPPASRDGIKNAVGIFTSSSQIGPESFFRHHFRHKLHPRDVSCVLSIAGPLVKFTNEIKDAIIRWIRCWASVFHLPMKGLGFVFVDVLKMIDHVLSIRIL